jgi:hypothetical protein
MSDDEDAMRHEKVRGKGTLDQMGRLVDIGHKQ